MAHVFKQGPIPTLVAVVTTMHNGIVNSAPVTWFTPCSYTPAMIMVALKKDNDTIKNIEDTEEFVIQTVEETCFQDVHNMAKTLPRTESELDQDNVNVATVDSKKVKVPRLNIAVQWYECKLVTIREIGDTHKQVFAEVVNHGTDKSNPLLYCTQSLYLMCSTGEFVEAEKY